MQCSEKSEFFSNSIELIDSDFKIVKKNIKRCVALLIININCEVKKETFI